MLTETDMTVENGNLLIGREGATALSDEDCRIVVSAMMSKDYVIVDRARFERLRVAAEAVEIWRAGGEGDREADAALNHAAKNLQPSDTDPLP